MKITKNFPPFEIFFRNDVDQSVITEVLAEKEYRKADKLISSAKNAIVDIGAHIGCFALYTRSLNMEVPLFCFEAHPNNFEILKKNVKENHLKNITTKNQSVSNTTEETELKLSYNNHNHSLVDAIDSNNQTIKVPSTTLKKIINKFSLTHIDLVKMDCEGSEFEIIQSLDEETAIKISAFIFEYHQTKERDPKSLIKKLETYGFRSSIFPSHFDKNMGFIFSYKTKTPRA